MVTIGFKSEEKEKQFKDLEQGACFVVPGVSVNLYMKITSNKDRPIMFTAIQLSNGHITEFEAEDWILEYDVDMMASGA